MPPPSTLDWLGRLVEAAPILLVILGAVALTVFGTLAGVDAIRGRTSRRTEQLILHVMRETALRRDRGETLGRALSLVRRQLEAEAGVVATQPQPGSPLHMLSAEGVARLDLVLQLPAEDPLVIAARQTSPAPLVTAIPSGSRWAALLGGRDGWISLTAFGNDQELGLMALAWPRRQGAQTARSPLTQVSMYLSQVLADFGNFERRARELQALNGDLRDLELLVRTSAHDLGNALVEPSVFIASLEGQLEPDLEENRTSAETKMSIVSSMVDDLVDPKRAIEAEPIPLEDIIQLAIPMYAALRPQGPKLQIDAPPTLPTVGADRVAILRVVLNLLTNASVHNADKPDLQVVFRVRVEGGRALLEVEDNGRGVAAEDLDRIFEFGVRVNATGKVRGHGLGLSSSRRLIEAHGGRLTVVSTPGAGARFSAWIPLDAIPNSD
jgi:signal transduction histidine kinase